MDWFTVEAQYFRYTARLGTLGFMAEDGVQRRLAAILAADVVGYSLLISDDEAGSSAAHRTQKTLPISTSQVYSARKSRQK